MRFGSVYFFAEEQIDFALWYTLIRIIRKDKPDCHFTLIYSLRDRSKKYDISFYLSLFDEVYKVDHVSYWKNGIWRKGLTMRTFLYALRNNFRSAYGVMRQLKKIKFSPGSIAFVNNGLSLNHALFLKCVKSINGIKSVLFLSPDQVMQESNIEDYVLHPKRSAYLNLHLNFFGTAPLDVYWIKTKDNIRTNYREFYFRENPADYVFKISYPMCFRDQKKNQILFPLFQPNKELRKHDISTSVFIGQPHYWIEGLSELSQEKFYLRLNEIILLIKEKNSSQRLLYKRHPGEIGEKFARIDTSGFEIESSISSEALFFNDSSITTVYAFSSASVQIAASLGITSYYIYNLFDAIDLGVPATIQRHWNSRWFSEIHPEMNIRSVDDWMNGKNDYKPMDLSETILDSTRKMLSTVDFN